MTRLTEQILSHATGLPEGAPVSAKSLLHLGNRAAVDQALSRLSERGQLIRAGRGVYLRPIASRFGTRTPSVEQAVEALANQKGEIIVSNGAAAANALGLTTHTRQAAPYRRPALTQPYRFAMTDPVPFFAGYIVGVLTIALIWHMNRKPGRPKGE